MKTRNYKPRYRKEAIDYLGGKCCQCGAIEQLEFDHIKPEQKQFNIRRALTTLNSPTFLMELRKCQLLCSQCHKEKTRLENTSSPIKHGTTGGYTNRKCRCELCCRSWADFMREYKRSRRLQEKQTS